MTKTQSNLSSNSFKKWNIKSFLFGKLIGIKNFERSWTAICGRSAVKGLRFHDLKREVIYRLFERGLSVSEVQLFCGNLLSSLTVYTQHNSTTLADKWAL